MNEEIQPVITHRVVIKVTVGTPKCIFLLEESWAEFSSPSGPTDGEGSMTSIQGAEPTWDAGSQTAMCFLHAEQHRGRGETEPRKKGQQL